MSTRLFRGASPSLSDVTLGEWEPVRFGGGGRVRCPRCGWRPPAAARWACSCGELWNTFATSGRCPACSRDWERTQCLRCQTWSRHQDWYAPENPDS